MPLKIQMVICRMTTDTSTVKLRSNEDFFSLATTDEFGIIWILFFIYRNVADHL